MFKKIRNLVCQFCLRPVFRQFVRYGITGSTTVIINLALLFIFTEFFGLWYMFSAVIAGTACTVFNFLMNRRWSFKSNGTMHRQMVKYLLLLGFNYLYSLGALYLLVELLHINYLLAQIIVSMVMVSWNFAMFRYVIYK